MEAFLTVILFLVVLSVLVIAHELGHFFMAKRAGLRVDEFGFGFPPRIYGVKRGGTLYSLNAIPLGGFVKIHGVAGDDPDAKISEPPSDSFLSCSPLKKFGILFAGIAMNFVLAAVLLTTVYAMGTAAPSDNLQWGAVPSDDRLYVTVVGPDTPAEAAGLQPGDAIRRLNGETLRQQEFQSAIEGYNGQEVTLELERAGDRVVASVTPSDLSFSDKEYIGIGVGVQDVVTVRYPLPIALWQGVKTTAWLTGQIVLALVDMGSSLFSGGGVGDDISGPVGIAVLTGEVASAGLIQFLQFMALLSINLALFNLLPIPALDGGRIIFVLLEQIRGKPVSHRTEGLVHSVGFGLLLLLVFIVTVRDIGTFF